MAHVQGVRSVQVSGNVLVSGADDKIVFIWNLKEGQCELILKGHEGGINGLHLVGIYSSSSPFKRKQF